ncbi:MAG: NUDIX hydrolase [Chloroflexi bacterium]|nr:NUDIX hydrolase [Chloroflexota bacterium]
MDHVRQISNLPHTEIAALAEQYGAPLCWTREIVVAEKSFAWWREIAQDRPGEIVLVVARPNGRVLLHTKSFYPPGTYRLMTGGLKFGEPIADAAQRELVEETGLRVPLARFLGVIEYAITHADARAQVRFVSYIFRTGETRDAPSPTDPDERIADFREIAWSEISQIADALENLPDDWRDWGFLRAVPHRLVAEIVTIGASSFSPVFSDVV